MHRAKIIDDVWRSAPVSIWSHLFQEIIPARRNVVVVNDRETPTCTTEASHSVGSRRQLPGWRRRAADLAPGDSPANTDNLDFRVGGLRLVCAAEPNSSSLT